MKQTTHKILYPESDFRLIGIASHENDYRLAWAINNQLQISLTKTNDIVIYHDKYKHDISISVFSQEFSDQGYTLKLFANRGEDFFLLEEYRNIDFFMKIDGIIADAKFLSFIENLKEISMVMGIYPLAINQIKKISRISF